MASTQLTLYWGSGSPTAWRVLIFLAEKNIQFESKLLSLMKGEHKSPEYLKINPNGQVPALTDGDINVYDSLAILHYLEEKYGVLGSKEPATRAKVLSRTFEFLNNVWSPSADVLRFVWHTGNKEDAIAKYHKVVNELKR